MPMNVTVWTAGKSFSLDLRDRSIRIASAPRIGLVVACEKDSDNSTNLSPSIRNLAFKSPSDRTSLRDIENIVRRSIRRRLPPHPDNGDIAVRALLVSVTNIRLMAEVLIERSFDAGDCGGERVPRTRRRLANAEFRLRAQTYLEADYDVELDRVIYDDGWKVKDIVEDGRPSRRFYAGDSWGSREFVQGLDAACVDPGAGQTYDWHEIGERLTREIVSTAG